MWSAPCNMASRLHILHPSKCVIYLVFLATFYCTCGSEITVITEGKRFLLAFPENLPNDCQFILNLSTAMTPSFSTTLIYANISVPALNTSKLLTMLHGATTGISLRGTGLSPDAASNVSRNNIIHLDVTNGKLSVFGSIICDSAAIVQRKFGEFLAIPIEFWGTRYVVVSPPDTTCGYTTTILTSNLDTEVNVKLKIRSFNKDSGKVHIAGKNVKDEIILNLQPYTRTEITGSYTDITGTILESDFPIGILVGPNNEASIVSAFCNNVQSLFIEQLIPTYAWGRRYYILDGGASSNVRYKYDVRIVTFTVPTTVFYNYLTSYPNQTLKFQNTNEIKQAGGIHDFRLADNFGFEMVGSDSPVLAVVYTSPVKGGDGAMSQAVQSRYFPERVTLRVSPQLGQRMYLFTDTACSGDLNMQIQNAFAMASSFSSLDYGKNGTEFYITSSSDAKYEFQAVLTANTGIKGCNGISAFIMNDIRNGYDVLAACPVFWSVECLDGKYFDLGQKACVPTQTTTLDSASEDQQLHTVLSSSTSEDQLLHTVISSSTTLDSASEDQQLHTVLSLSSLEHTTDGRQMTSPPIYTSIPANTLFSTQSLTETVTASYKSLYSGYATEAVVTTQESTERSELTEPGLFSSFFVDMSTKMASEVTFSQTLTSTFSVTKSHFVLPHQNGTLTLDEGNNNKSLLTNESTTPNSAGPLISPLETVPPFNDNAGGADDVVKASVSYCPCMCQVRTNTTNLYILPAADILKVSVSNLSRHRRARTSAKDSRPLSVSFGTLGIAMFVCIFLFALLPSIVNQRLR